jgi:hypothetical protein
MTGLYETDFALWAAEQASALRDAAHRGSNTVDWENVAEEIESLGRSERRALASHIAVVIEHLLKLQTSPATGSRRQWRESVRRARQEINRVLKDSPSLRREVPEIVTEQAAAVRVMIAQVMAEYDETPLVPLEAIAFDEARVLGDWMPAEEGAPA